LGLILALFLAALSGGYALSSTVGQGAVRREAENQLARLLMGRVTIERADLLVRSGFWIEGRGVHVYPTATGPELSGERVSARLDILALLRGRFRVQELILDGVHLEIERSEADRWSPYPINAIDQRGQVGDSDDLERKLGAFRVVDIITRVLLETPFIAQEIEVKDSSVRLVDRFVRGKGAPPLETKIESINGTLLHDWIGDRADLVLSGQLSDEIRDRIPIEVSGERRTDGAMSLSIAVTKIELESYSDYFQNQEEKARRAREGGDGGGPALPTKGLLSGVVRFETPEREHGVLEFDLSGQDVSLGLNRGEGVQAINSPRLQLRSRVEIHPGRVRISEARLRGPDIQVDVSGDIERPLRSSSPTNLAVYFHDVGLEALARIADALPQDGRDPLLRTLAQIEEGKVVRFGGSGTERFSVWQDVLRGERLDLPAGLSMLAEVSGVTIQLGKYERLSNLSGSATWTRDRLRVSRTRATRKGVPTAQLNLTIDGFPALFEQVETFDANRVSNVSLPGLALLNQVFASPSVSEAEAKRSDSPTEIELDIDVLEHTALLWPLRDAQIGAVLHESEQSFRIERGIWGGANVRGDVLVSNDPEPTIDAQLLVWPVSPTEPTVDGGLPVHDAWASGNFVVVGLHGKQWPVGPTVATFALRGETLGLVDVNGQLIPTGTLTGDFEVDLSNSERLAFETRFQIRDGDAGRLMEAVGFPNDFATGDFDVDGELKGPVDPDESAFAFVSGQIQVEGSDGQIRQSIPLAAAVAHAAEGLSAAEAVDMLQYETISTLIRFQRGQIATEEIKLDGPLRIFLSGTFDFGRPGRAVDGEIGIFLFRQVDQLLGNFPLLSNLIPGGKGKGLFGAFFEVDGTLEEPVLTALPMKSLTEGIPVPDLVKAPFGAIRQALQGGRKVKRETRD